MSEQNKAAFDFCSCDGNSKTVCPAAFASLISAAGEFSHKSARQDVLLKTSNRRGNSF